MGPMLNTNTKRGLLQVFLLETLKLVLGYSKETLEHLPSACLCDSFDNPDRGGKNQTLFVAFVVVIVEDLFQPEHVRKSKEAPC